MRLGIVSDIHCNAEGLRLAIEKMGHVDELLCAGDAIFEYRFSNDVVEALRETGARWVLGNHEMTFLGPLGVRARSSANIRSDELAYMAERPLRIEVDVGGKKLLMVHGSPFEPYDTYVYPTSPIIPRFAELDADYVILGHTHCKMAVRAGRTLVINPGSTGDGRDERNNRALSYAILDTVSGGVTFEDFFVTR
jgi:putative phosphoesterase